MLDSIRDRATDTCFRRQRARCGRAGAASGARVASGTRGWIKSRTPTANAAPARCRPLPAQLAQDFDAELGKAGFALQIEPSIVEQQQWSQFAAKYQAWADNAASTRIVQSIYFVERPLDGPGADAGPLRVWNPSTHTFEVIDWPSELASIRARFLHDPTAVVDMSRPTVRWTTPGGGREGDRRRDERREERSERSLAEGGRGRGQSRAEAPRGEGGRSGQRLLFPPVPMPAGDPQSLIMPVLRITGPAPTGDARQTPDVKLLGFTVIRFDLTALATEVLPGLVKKHLYDADGQTEFAVAVVSRNDPSQTLFESQPGAAAMAEASPDAAVSLLGPTTGQFLFMARGDRRGAPPPRPPPPPPPGVESKVVVNVIETARNDGSGVSVQRTAFAGEGHWRLIVKHRAGSLEAAVAAARTRNFVLSSSILALLAAAIGLIVVSARRADRLARQQIEFVAAVSHELRTPVSVIGAAAGNLADGLVDNASRVKTYGATIQTEARRLGETVERVLQLAGIAAGSAAAARTALPVPALVEEAVAATRHESEAAGVTVEVAIADELWHSPTDPSGVQRVVGDPVALRSAIQNLISNAIKYSGEARWVRVSAISADPQDDSYYRRGSRARHCRRGSQARLRAVLPRSRGGVASDSGQRPRLAPRAANHRSARRHRDGAKRGGPRQHLHHRSAGGA